MPAETKEREIWIGTCFQKVEALFFKKKNGEYEEWLSLLQGV